MQKLIAAAGRSSRRGRGRSGSTGRRTWSGSIGTKSDRLRSSDAVPIRPERICKEISDWLPEGGVVLSDTGHAGMWTGQMIRLTRPGQRFLRCAGSLGWAFPATLGAKCALPDRPVIGFSGDGGFYYHLAELETAARFNINAIMLVNNNYALNQEKHLFDAAYGGQQRGRATEMWHFSPEVNFAKVAEAMGCVGIRVERPEDIRPALDKALAASCPAVVEVISDVDAMAEQGVATIGDMSAMTRVTAERRTHGSPDMKRPFTQGPGRLFYGWWIVIIGCIQDAVKGGTFNTGFTLYFLPILTELHLSRAATSLPFSLARLEAALEGPLVGYLIDRFDVRVMLVVGTTLAGLGFILLSFTDSYLFFVLVFMGPLTMGFQAGFNHATMAAVNHWFRRKRGLAMSIVQTGQAIGGVLIFPLVALAVLQLGWRPAAFLSGLVVLLLLPLVLLVRHSPESMGLLPDGERAGPVPIPSAGAIDPGFGSTTPRSSPPGRPCGCPPSGRWPPFMACAIFPTAESPSTWCPCSCGRGWTSRRRRSSWGSRRSSPSSSGR